MEMAGDQKQTRMEISPEKVVSTESKCDRPYRGPKGRRKAGEKGSDEAEIGLKRRLEIVEKELQDSKKEIKHLKVKLEEADRERKETMNAVSSLYVQVQYWNSWLGKFTTHLKENDQNSDVKKEKEREKNNDEEIDLADDNGDVDESQNEKGKLIQNNSEGRAGNQKDIIESINYNGNKNDSNEMSSVADMLKETAETAYADSGMSYDANSGLYYDWSSHMYYDPKTHLFYDNDNGIYYYYDNTKRSYVFYSQVDIHSPKYENATSPLSSKDRSEGELSSSDCEKEEETVACIRAIVTAAETVKIGTLYLVTCTGVAIGCDKNSTFNVPDDNVSKTHAVIKYDSKDGKYYIKDEGSMNGTFLNDKRLSESKIESKWFALKHKDFLKIGSTVFVLHLHRGLDTCDDCEPGQVQALISSCDSNATQHGSWTKEQMRKKQLKGLKEKYMVNGNGLKQALKPITSGKYKDRASRRRQNIGSEPLKEMRKHMEEERSSVTKMISEKNKGHQMMQKMGWKSGEGLGKERKGIKEPINVVIREKNKGLGSGITQSIDGSNQTTASQKWKKAKQRYDNLLEDERNHSNQIKDNSTDEFDF